MLEIYRIDSFKPQFGFYYFLVCSQLNQNLDMMLLSDYANPYECLKSFLRIYSRYVVRVTPGL